MYYILNSLIVAPIGEELFYRLILVNHLLPVSLKNKKIIIYISIAFISLLFALSHLNFEPSNLISHFFFSVFVTTIYFKTRNIWLAIAIHSFYNLTVVMHFQYYLQEINANGTFVYTVYVFALLCCVFFTSKIILSNDEPNT